jgi:hypothetical protein
MLNAGSAALADLSDIEPALLEVIQACLPSGRHIDLDLGIAALSTRLTAHRLATTQDPAATSRAPSHPCERPARRRPAPRTP